VSAGPGPTSDSGPATAPVCAPDEHCITCGDVAVPMRVVRTDAADGLAWCRAAEHAAEPAASLVDVTLVGALAPGDLVLVHAGAALARLPEPGDAA
jgi:hydrogenase maturation factor